MKHFLSIVLLSSMALATPVIFAEEQPATQDQQIHHPDEKKTDAKTTTKAVTPDSGQKTDLQMAAMMSMHNKMMNAKTPEERNALMAEHMKVMQDSMSMMNSMSKDAKGMMSGMMMGGQGKETSGMMSGMPDMMQQQQMMEKRMDMMQMMMQMMMDRLPAEPKK